MSSYVITEQDKAEFERDIKPQRIGDAEALVREVQKVMRKKK